ncbi:MAG: glycosyltransferase family 39 protein [Myxococcota bacterium]
MSSRTDAFERLTVLLALLFLVWGIGLAGLWDPWEVDVAEAARTIRDQADSHDAATLSAWLTHFSFRTFGIHAWAGRLPGVLAALAACALLFSWVGRDVGVRVGRASVVVLATSVLFVLQARLVLGDALAMFAQAWVGYAAFRVSSPTATQTRTGLAATTFVLVAGLLVSTWTSGVLLGPLPPLFAVAAWSWLPAEAPAPPCSLPGRAVISLATLGLGVGVLRAVQTDATDMSLWLGGGAIGVNPPTYDAALEVLFHGFAPWSAVFPVALVVMVTPTRGRASNAQNLAWLWAMWVAFNYVTWTVHRSRYGVPSFVAMVPMSGIVGLWLCEVTQHPRPRRASAIAVGLFAGLLIRDYVLYPESAIRGLPATDVGLAEVVGAGRAWSMIFGAFAVALLVVLWGGVDSSRLGSFRKRWPEAGLCWVLLSAVVVSAFVVLDFQPSLSRALSSKALYDAYEELDEGRKSPLVSYRLSPTGARYYTDTPVLKVDKKRDLVDYLAQPGQHWAVLPEEELPRVNKAYRAKVGRHLFVANDASTRRVLVASQSLEGHENLNFIARYVRSEPPQIGSPIDANFDNRVALRSLLIDLPHDDFVEPGERFSLTWVWEAIGPRPAGFEVFVHVDGFDRRINGDHAPVRGLYPFRYWSRGDFVIDTQTLRVPRTFPTGDYGIYVGLFKGDRRLEVRSNTDHASEHRVRAGTLRVR